MAALVTEDEALRQLRLNPADLAAAEIADVMFKADQASAIIVDYLKRPQDVPVVNPLRRGRAPTPDPLIFPPDPSVLEPWTEATAPVLVKAAILIVLTSLYDGRTPDDGLLTEPVTAILWRMRDPALA